MTRTPDTPDVGPLRERVDALIDRIAEPADEKATESLPTDAAETSLDGTRPQVPGE